MRVNNDKLHGSTEEIRERQKKLRLIKDKAGKQKKASVR